MVGPFGLRPRGTMSVRALPLAQALVARGHEVTLLLPPWQNPEDSGRRQESGGVTVENIPLPPRVPVLFHLLVALRLTRRTCSLRPDVVHLFKPKAYSGLTHYLLAGLPRSRRPRLVVDSDDWEGPGGWNAIGGYTPLQRWFFERQEKWGLTNADAVTVASRTLEGLVWALGVEPERVFYLPNGARDIRPAPFDRPHPPTVLLYTRFFEFPVSRVVEVMRRVRERVPAARLVVVGEGLFGEEKELSRLAYQAGMLIGRDVVLRGWVPAADLPARFAQADVAIYPFDDTLVNRAKCPVKLLDLLAAGVPVVAEAVGEIREMIQPERTGYLVRTGDVDAFAGAVVRLLGDKGLRERVGRAAAADVRERFSWARLAEEAERAYGVE